MEVLNANISVLHNEYDSYDFYRWIQTDNSFILSDELWHETEIEASIFDGGDGTSENPYRIATKEQLLSFAESLDTEILYDGKYVELTADIDISDIANWEPIGKSEFAFNGIFNGNGHTVSGLKEGTEKSPRKLSTNYEDFSNALGFFGTLGVDAVVKNLNLTDVAIYSYRDDSSFVGGIVGYMQGLTDESSRKGAIIDNCYVQGTICSTTHEKNAYVGGIAARQYKGAIINCHTDVDLKSTVKIVVVDGEVVSTELLTGSKEDTEKYENAIARAQSKAIYGDTTGYGKGDASRFAGGDGTKENPYLIANEEQLRYIAEAINEDETWENKFFKQIADITLSDKDFMPIGFAIKAKINGDPVLYSAYPFRGNYDGADHVIKGFRIGSEDKAASLYTAAMFGFTGGDYDSNILFDDSVLKVELKNIHLEDIFINNVVLYDTYTAGLVGTGQNGVFIDNCSVTGKISVKAYDIASRGAGLAASMLRGAVTNSWTDVDISAITEDGDVYAGGMFAVTNRINAINCYTLGDVIATANTNNKVHIGGFTGMAGAFQYNCFAMGNVTSDRPSVDIGIMDGRIANIAYDRKCYFNSDAVISENGVVIESVYTGADGTGSSKDVTFGKTKDEFGSQEFMDVLNKNIENVDSELEIADEELGGIMSIYYKDGAPGLMRWKLSYGIPVLAVQKQETAPEEKPEQKAETKPEEKPEQKAETKPEEKPEQKTETKPEEKPEPKTENEPIVKTETTQNNTSVISSGDSNSQNNPSASANETVSSPGNVSASKSNATESINITNLNGIESTKISQDNIAAKTQNLESQNLKTDTAETTKTALASTKEKANQDIKVNTSDNTKEKASEDVKENVADSSAVTEDVGVEKTKDDNTIDKQEENKETAVEEKTVSDIPEEDVPLSPGNEKNSSNLPVTAALIIIVAGIVAAGIIMRKKLVIK